MNISSTHIDSLTSTPPSAPRTRVKPAVMRLTEAAISRIRVLLSQRDKPSLGIRVGVKSGGCSGLAYTIEYADNLRPHEEIISLPREASEDSAPQVMIDPKAVMYLMGTEMDFVEETLKSGFVFRNPNEKGTCGCGESFHV